MASETKNLGTKTRTIITLAKHPDVDRITREQAAMRAQSKVDVLLVNPPTPDGSNAPVARSPPKSRAAPKRC